MKNLDVANKRFDKVNILSFQERRAIVLTYQSRNFSD